MKTIIATIPKAGTYLAREILVNAGLECDPRHRTQGSVVFNIRGDFCVGHPKFHMSPFQTVFIHRDLRDALVSSIKYSMKIGERSIAEVTSDTLCRAIKAFLPVPKMAPMMAWYHGATLTLGFHQLAEKHYVAEMIQLVSGEECSLDKAQGIIDASTNTPTQTWTGKKERSTHEQYWTQEVQDLWVKTLFSEYNEYLGYESRCY